jgi:hypothetical protein
MPEKHFDQAIGSYEAACLMGFHFGQPQKLVATGVLTGRVVMTSAYSNAPVRRVSVYDGLECERNYREYEEKVASRGGRSERRPREWLHLRPEAISRLKAVENPIAFDDAVTVAEAAEILGVHPSLVPRLIAKDRINGRVPWNPRGQRGGSRNWIISRRSCLEQLRLVRAAEAAGSKVGRPRRKTLRAAEALAADLIALRSVDEGRVIDHMTRRRERKRKIIELKKKHVMQVTKALLCEVCRFDFHQFYGSRGEGYAECHHRVPLGTGDLPRKTRIADLAIVCANCHRMLHQQPSLTVEELRILVETVRHTPGKAVAPAALDEGPHNAKAH